MFLFASLRRFFDIGAPFYLPGPLLTGAIQKGFLIISFPPDYLAVMVWSLHAIGRWRCGLMLAQDLVGYVVAFLLMLIWCFLVGVGYYGGSCWGWLLFCCPGCFSPWFLLWCCIGDTEAFVGLKSPSSNDSHGFWDTLSKTGAYKETPTPLLVLLPQWVFLGTLVFGTFGTFGVTVGIFFTSSDVEL